MQNESSKLEDKLGSDKLVIEYSEKVKKREPSLRKVVIIATISYMILMLIWYAVIFPYLTHQKTKLHDTNYLIITGLAWLAGSVLYGLLMYVFLRWFQRRGWKEIKYASPVPESIGRVIREIPSSRVPNLITIGGKLVIGEKGICFLPHRFIQWHGKVLTADWANTGRIYRSRGRFSPRGLLTASLRDRLAIEINGRDHFFICDPIDSIITELEHVRELNLNKTNERPEF
jgi:hypothetical protein